MTMASSISSATNNNVPIGTANVANNSTNDAQMNFNPSWMKSTAPPMQRSLSVSTNSSHTTSSAANAGKKIGNENDETCEPIFAKHSYGREDLLAMMGKNTLMKPPNGLKRCPFFVDAAQTPIILLPFTDTEMRLQQNMNSSKAMNAKKKTFSRIGTPLGQKIRGLAERGDLVLDDIGCGDNMTDKTLTTAECRNGSEAGTVGTGTPTRTKSRTPPQGSAKGNKESSPPPSLGVRKAAPAATASSVVGKNTTPSPQGVQQKQQHWCYLDPSGVQRGPFDGHQMQAWFSSGYFSDTLQVRRKEETTYTTLGELSMINGKETPFKVHSTAVTPPATAVQKQQQQKQQTTAPSAAFPTVQQQQRISPSHLLESATASAVSGGGGGHKHPQQQHISPNLADVERIWAATPFEDAVVGGGTGRNAGAPSVAAAAPPLPLSSKVVAPPSSNNNNGGGGGSSTVAAAAVGAGPGGVPNATMTMLQNTEMRILEEQRKLRDKEELLRRDELERAEKEQRMRDMETELKRHQEELGRRAREKDAEFEQRYAQMADYERKRRDELAALEQRIRNEHLQHQMRLEEQDRRRAKELEELLRRDQDRQHQLVEAEVMRKREEEEMRLRLAFQEQQHQHELVREKARRAEEEQRRHLIEEQQRAQQKALDEARAERAKQLQAVAKAEAAAKAAAAVAAAEHQQRVSMASAAAQWQQQQQQSMAVNNSGTIGDAYISSAVAPPHRASAWQTIPTPAMQPIGQQQQVVPPPLPAAFHQSHLHLQHPDQQQQTIVQQPAVTEQRRGWQPVQLPKAAPIPPAINKTHSSMGGDRATAAKVAVGNKQHKQQQPQKHKQVPPVVEDKFTVWIIKRVKELNPSVDAEVFATFISGIDSPHEAEDYIVGYLGEKKEVKEFHRDFLQKRIELRPRAHHQAPKDDLSRPAAALGADLDQHHKGGSGTGGLAASGTTTGGGQQQKGGGIGGGGTTATAPNCATATMASANGGKKKKGQKGQKVVLDKSHQLCNKFTVLDPTTLGFRPASDPNRVNAGEIDCAPPAPGGGANKKR